MEFKDRLKLAREEKGISPPELARRLSHVMGRKISTTLIQKLESGAIKSTTYILEIAEILGVSPFWLRFGRGEKYLKTSGKIYIDVPILRWDDLNNGQINTKSDILTLLRTKATTKDVENMDFKEEDIIGNTVAVIKAEDIQAMRPAHSHPQAIFSTDILIFDFNKTPSPGEIVLAHHKKGFVVRQYMKDGNSFILSALNDKYPNIEEFEVCGVVIERRSDFTIKEKQ